MADHIATYLNDHLAGSVVALELLEHLEGAHANTDLEQWFAQLSADIAKDRGELEALMARLEITESRTRKASAWLTEKMTELKLRIDDPAGGSLRLFESLEGLSLGIEGKRLLWIALATASENSPALKILDYQRLMQRAQEQRDRVEELRVTTARKALAPESSAL
jgi:Skp family chaperone for outer membrane proteins